MFTILGNTLDCLRTNLHGTETVLETARAHGVPILVASTSEIYGKNTADGLSEEADRVLGSPLKNRWSYAEAKALDEAGRPLPPSRYWATTAVRRWWRSSPGSIPTR
ncbi:UDP-glucose 4-epimerase [Streptomyces badius]